LAELQRAISLKPNFVEARYLLGQTLQQLGKFEDAKRTFAEAERLQLNDADIAEATVQYNLGLQEIQKRDLAAARNAFQVALQHNEDFPEAHTNLGGVLLELGDVDSAIGHFYAAIDLRPDDARAYFNLSLALKKKGDSTAAQEARKKAVELDPRLDSSVSPGHTAKMD
jgi:tetratricopeptide (TPR) repeat protein